ncbi:DUF4465 domain-containing protein [Myroides sp. N17-2]|uniref:DUF4465 domain-containing protein n=1 Tax=Myroides sp. N17-2 TaxID=2030799 RepID=UPI000EFAF27B|nr:DUF4465 domain-containing protein [Myroides sp. N17-2]
MKKQLTRLSTFLLLGLTLLTANTFVSCSNDDNVPYSIPTPRGSVASVTFDEVTIDPALNNAGASYRWINNATQEVLSTQSVFKYTFNTPGTYSLVLSEQQGSSYNYYTYTVVVGKSYNYNYVTLDLSSFNLSDGEDRQGGKIWKDTYTSNVLFKSQIFTFAHTAEKSWNYWDGFTVSNIKDNATHSNDGSSNGWLDSQWGAMPKGGVKGEGTPYVVGYWGYYMKDWQADETIFDEKQYSNWIKIGDKTDSYNAVSVSLANHPWPYWGNLNGDGFATKFEKGDYFTITIKGVDKNNKVKSNSITHYLADYRGDKLIMSKEWEKIDISSLGEVSYIFFQLDSTDELPGFGPNTAVYFCVDALTVDKIEKK